MTCSDMLWCEFSQLSIYRPPLTASPHRSLIRRTKVQEKDLEYVCVGTGTRKHAFVIEMADKVTPYSSRQ